MVQEVTILQISSVSGCTTTIVEMAITVMKIGIVFHNKPGFQAMRSKRKY